MAKVIKRRPAAGGVVLVNGRVLLLRKRLNGELRLPKGTIDEGEDACQAALREVREETGFADLTLDGDLGEQRIRFQANGQTVSRTARFYRMGLETYRRYPRDIKDAQRFAVLWMDAYLAIEALTFDDERQALQRALERRAT